MSRQSNPIVHEQSSLASGFIPSKNFGKDQLKIEPKIIKATTPIAKTRIFNTAINVGYSRPDNANNTAPVT